MAQAVETVDMANETNPNTPNISMHPILNLKQGGKPRFAILGGLVFFLLVGGLGYFVFHEYSSKKQALSALAQAEQERARLESSLTQIRSDMEKQKEEMTKLADDFEAATRKSSETEKLLADREAELTKVYGEINSLKKTVKDRDTLVSTLEANIKTLKGMLEDKGQSLGSMSLAGPGAVIQPTKPAGQPAEISEPVVGKVVSVDLRNRFVVINLGPAQGAEQGKWVQIFRNQALVGKGRIDRIYEYLSAVTILSEDTLSRVQKGDQVYLSLS